MPRSIRLKLIGLPLIVFLSLTTSVYSQSTFDVPSSRVTQHLAIQLPNGADLDRGASWQLVEIGDDNVRFPAQIASAVDKNGKLKESGQQLLVTIAPGKGDAKTRKFRLEETETEKVQSAFRFERVKDLSLKLMEGDTNILTYNYGTITDPNVPETDARRSRGCYIHPVWGMSGEVLTADFPRDHYHHHGIFWSWPYIKVNDEVYDLWVYSNIQQRFVRWLHQETGPVAAVLGVENGWFVGDRQVATERVWIVSYRSETECRSIDLMLAVEALDQPVTLQGRQSKSYGGLTARFDVWPRTDAKVRAPDRTLGNVGKGAASEQDLLNTPLPWADLASKFPGAEQRSGAAVFIAPNHPDYPPTWLTRTYGALCVGWPGVKPYTIDAHQSIQLNYRLWVHQSEVPSEQIDGVYQSYRKGTLH